MVQNEETITKSSIKEDFNNKFIARGRVVGFSRDYQGRMQIDLYIRGEYQARPIEVSIVYSSLEEVIEVGDFVEIEGYLVSYYRNDDSWSFNQSSTTLVQYFVLTSISKLKTEIEEAFNINGGFSHKNLSFRMYYRGIVSSITKNDGKITDSKGNKQDRVFIRINVRTPRFGSGRSNIISAHFTDAMRIAKPKNGDVIEKGDEIVVVANLVSTRKEFNRSGKSQIVRGRRSGRGRNYGVQRVLFNNLLVDDLLIVKKANDAEESPSTNSESESVSATSLSTSNLNSNVSTTSENIVDSTSNFVDQFKMVEE